MHRRMIGEVTAKLRSLGLQPIKSWNSPPVPVRTSVNLDGFSVPPSWDHQLPTDNDRDRKIFDIIKSDEYWASRMSFLDRKFKNPDYLATLTLDQLGAKIEWLIHNPMHIRWSSRQLDPISGALLPSGRAEPDIDDKWIKREVSETGPGGQVIKRVTYYDDLNDTLSSHVHPVFWRLHGWVDDRINDWFAAHERVHPGEVVRNQTDGVPWFATGKWVAVAAPWVGPAGMHGHGEHSHGDHKHGGDSLEEQVRKMERAHQLIFNPAVQPATARATSKVNVKALMAQ